MNVGGFNSDELDVSIEKGKTIWLDDSYKSTGTSWVVKGRVAEDVLKTEDDVFGIDNIAGGDFPEDTRSYYLILLKSSMDYVNVLHVNNDDKEDGYIIQTWRNSIIVISLTKD